MTTTSLKLIRGLFLIFTFCCVVCEGGVQKNILNDLPVVYLTWQHSPETTMTVNWVTPLNQNGDTLEYRKANGENWSQAAGFHGVLPEKAPYILELTNLQPKTIYQFRFGKDGVIYKFQTMPDSLEQAIRFVVGGDMYHDGLETLRQTNQVAAKTDPLFALVGGDIAYASNKFMDFLPRWIHPYVDKLIGQKFDRWLEWLIAWKEDMVTSEGCLIPMLPAIGNHDTVGRFDQTPEQAPFFYSLFPMPGKPGYNVVDFADYMSIFLLDSGHTNPVGGRQAQWLAAAMQQRQDIFHKFALYHVPAFPSVHKETKEIGAQIRKFWVPSFDEYHLTAAFENHEHAYKRTHPILGGAIAVDGVVYVGDGGWGVDKPRQPRGLKEKWYLAKAASVRHFLVVDIEKDKQTVKAVDYQGNVIDSYSW